MRYKFTLKSISPLLMHADDVELADRLSVERKAAKNKAVSKAGDDRFPAWSWQTYCYSDGKQIVIPSENLSACLLQAGATMKGNKGKSLKEASQTGLAFDESMFVLLANGKPVPISAIEATKDATFPEQCELVKPLGFSLFIKRARVGTSKHVRVRPRFENWSISGTVETFVPELTADVLAELFRIAGFSKGLCDWRPGSPTKPGPFGRFEAELSPIK